MHSGELSQESLEELNLNRVTHNSDIGQHLVDPRSVPTERTSGLVTLYYAFLLEILQLCLYVKFGLDSSHTHGIGSLHVNVLDLSMHGGVTLHVPAIVLDVDAAAGCTRRNGKPK